MVKVAEVSVEMKDSAHHVAGHAMVGLAVGCLIETIGIDSDGGRVRFFGGGAPVSVSRHRILQNL